MANSNESKLAIKKEVEVYVKRLRIIKRKRDALEKSWLQLKEEYEFVEAAIAKLKGDLGVRNS